MIYKVKYHDTVEPMNFEERFNTQEEAVEWINRQMSIWRDSLYDEYPEADVTWLNRFLDCGNVTEIYIPDTTISITCELVCE